MYSLDTAFFFEHAAEVRLLVVLVSGVATFALIKIGAGVAELAKSITARFGESGSRPLSLNHHGVAGAR